MNNSAVNPLNFKLAQSNRTQYEFKSFCLDDLVPEDHKARLVWAFVSEMDLSACFDEISSLHGERGRPVTDPKITLTLWLYSILDGNISARKLEELCQNHDVYKWICGGVSVNRTSLAEFRSVNPRKFDDLLVKCLAVMVKNDLISDSDFSQDGTRVKGNAGNASFYRESTLKDLELKLSNHIKQLREEEKKAPNAYEKKKATEKKNRLDEKRNRVQAVLRALEEARSQKQINAKMNHDTVTEEQLKNVRASVTDPAIRKMKMGDNGFRLAYNVQFATGLDSRVIYGVDVVNTLDPGTAPRLMNQVKECLKKLGLEEIKNWIADAAYSAKKDLKTVAQLFPNCMYYAPPKVNKKIDPRKPLKDDCEVIKKWRSLIDLEETKEIYRKRCSTSGNLFPVSLEGPAS